MVARQSCPLHELPPVSHGICDALDDIAVSACLPPGSQITAVGMASQPTSQPCHRNLPPPLPSPQLPALLGWFPDSSDDVKILESQPLVRLSPSYPCVHV